MQKSLRSITILATILLFASVFVQQSFAQDTDAPVDDDIAVFDLVAFDAAGQPEETLTVLATEGGFVSGSILVDGTVIFEFPAGMPISKGRSVIFETGLMQIAAPDNMIALNLESPVLQPGSIVELLDADGETLDSFMVPPTDLSDIGFDTMPEPKNCTVSTDGNENLPLGHMESFVTAGGQSVVCIDGATYFSNSGLAAQAVEKYNSEMAEAEEKMTKNNQDTVNGYLAKAEQTGRFVPGAMTQAMLLEMLNAKTEGGL